MTIDENLYRVLADVDHQREFIITGDQTLTYGKVFEMAARFAASMAGLGVGPGERFGGRLRLAQQGGGAAV